jgi:hypothetical protein
LKKVFESKSRDASDDEEEVETAIDETKVRAYEKQRLRYYFAIAECNSVKVSKVLSVQCLKKQQKDTNSLGNLIAE